MRDAIVTLPAAEPRSTSRRSSRCRTIIRDVARFCDHLERARRGESLVGVVDKRLGY